MKTRFHPDVQESRLGRKSEELVDPEAPATSEQQFDVSLEQTGETRRPRFFIDRRPEENRDFESAASAGAESESPMSGREAVYAYDESSENEEESGSRHNLAAPDPDFWRREVARKVSHYRNQRRPKAPRYPSLQLKLDPLESREFVAKPIAVPDCQAVPSVVTSPEADADQRDQESITVSSDSGAKILEFPRPLPPPTPRVDALADPVFEAPRILEVPELLPPPPALGGILIEPVEQAGSERRPGFELPLQAASMSRRIVASMVDGTIVSFAFAMFSYVFFKMTAVIPSLKPTALFSVGLLFTFWSGYEYLLLVHGGSTPGLRLAKLSLSQFDGTPVPRRTRCWRVIASILSGLSLGLGYAWCFLDEDQLCWHDRITRTYMAPKVKALEVVNGR